MLHKIRIIAWVAVGLALIGFAVILLTRPSGNQPASAPTANYGGPFTLVSSDGKAFPSTRLAGRPYAIFFGFTHCPDVCPTTLARLVRLRQQLGRDGDKLQLLFVTLDPERDGPAEVGKYAELFRSPIIGLTGSPAQIERVKKQYGIFSQKVPAVGGDYGVDHTAAVLLFDDEGKYVGRLAPQEADETSLEMLRRII
jgi:protein SCO1/2